MDNRRRLKTQTSRKMRNDTRTGHEIRRTARARRPAAPAQAPDPASASPRSAISCTPLTRGNAPSSAPSNGPCGGGHTKATPAAAITGAASGSKLWPCSTSRCGPGQEECRMSRRGEGAARIHHRGERRRLPGIWRPCARCPVRGHLILGARPWLEDRLAQIGWHARSVIADRDLDQIKSAKVHRDPPLSMLTRVLHERRQSPGRQGERARDRWCRARQLKLDLGGDESGHLGDHRIGTGCRLECLPRILR